jgi:spore coat protein CotH
MHFFKLIALTFFFYLNVTFAQTAIYPSNGTLFDDSLHSIHILIAPSDFVALEHKDSLWNNRRYTITFIYDHRDTVKNTTIRLKGNTSRGSLKKSYRIDFDRIIGNQTFQGLKTVNLHGNHNDASMSREFLSAYIMKKMSVPVNRVNHVKLYINGQYLGVRTMVEYINKDFLKTRFGSNKGNNYKCTWPADLVWLGSDEKKYKDIINPSPLQERAYELKTNEDVDDYSRFVSLVNILNNRKNESSFPQEIEGIFDVNGYLKALAAEVLIGHWDNYFYNKNNYFIYDHPNTKQFTYIPYDMDNTFGVHWGVSNIHERDIHQWGNPNVYAPLAESLLARSTYRKQYEYYVYQAVQDFYNEDSLYPVVDALNKRLKGAILQDPQYKGEVSSSYGYTINHWEKSFTEGLGDHNAIGIKPFISSRSKSILTQLRYSHEISKIALPSLRIYPNPSNDWISLESAHENLITIEIFSVSGRFLTSKRIFSGEAFYVGDIAPGCYVIRAADHETLKWIKH